MARPGSDKESLVGLSSPQRWDVIVGRWELDRDCRLCCLGVEPSGPMPRSAAFPVLVNQRQRRRVCSIETASLMPLELWSWPFDRHRDHKKSVAVAAEQFR